MMNNNKTYKNPLAFKKHFLFGNFKKEEIIEARKGTNAFIRLCAEKENKRILYLEALKKIAEGNCYFEIMKKNKQHGEMLKLILGIGTGPENCVCPSCLAKRVIKEDS